MTRLFPLSPVWRNLYHAAVDFKNLAPWEWMYDSDLFGVQNPATGEIGYCAIMGALGEVLGIAVYLGSGGLEAYYQMTEGRIPVSEIVCRQKCLSLSFEDRDFLSKKDLNLIKELGLKFRGRNAWPLFRSYLPGYYPWYLAVEEAEFFTLVLQQVGDTARRFNFDPGLLDSRKANYFFVRVPEKAGNILIWKDAFLKHTPLARGKSSVEPVDEIRLQTLKTSFKLQGVWEGDYFYVPVPVEENKGQRRYYPLLMLFVDAKAGLILHGCNSSIKNFPNDYQSAFINAMEKNQAIPKEILITQKDLVEILEPIASRLKIKVKVVKKLKNATAAKSYFYEMLDSGQFPELLDKVDIEENYEPPPPKNKGRKKMRP